MNWTKDLFLLAISNQLVYYLIRASCSNDNPYKLILGGLKFWQFRFIYNAIFYLLDQNANRINPAIVAHPVVSA